MATGPSSDLRQWWVQIEATYTLHVLANNASIEPAARARYRNARDEQWAFESEDVPSIGRRKSRAIRIALVVAPGRAPVPPMLRIPCEFVQPGERPLRPPQALALREERPIAGKIALTKLSSERGGWCSNKRLAVIGEPDIPCFQRESIWDCVAKLGCILRLGSSASVVTVRVPLCR